jgi:hypothetical protein
MSNLHYTPEQLSGFTLPQFLCLTNKKPPSEKKLESMSEFSKILEEDARKEREWSDN